MDFQAEQLNVLQSILDKNATVASALGQDLKIITDFTAAVERFAFKHAASFKVSRFSLLFCPDSVGTMPLTTGLIQDSIELGQNLLRVDSKLRVIDAAAGNFSISAALKRTRESRTLEVLFHPSTLHYIVYGQHIHDEMLENQDKLPASQRWYRPFAEFGQILEDHMEGAVQYERDLRYWADRKKRILLATPDNTEKIFHGKLRWWLDNFLTDKLRVYAQPMGLGQDSTDIIVVTSSSAIFLIEVKWLGVNENKTKYDFKQIDKALVQVKEYLNKDKDVLGGYLVIYDGRSRDLHASQSNHSEKHRHMRCEKPILLFLESQTPSEIGAQVKN